MKYRLRAGEFRTGSDRKDETQMNFRTTHSDYRSNLIATAVVGCLLGLLLLLIPVQSLLRVIFVVLGIITIVCSLPGLLSGISAFETRTGKALFFLSLCLLVLGILLIFFHNGILMILLGISMLALPLIRIFRASDRREMLRQESPKMILGTVLILLGPANALEWFFRIAGAVVLALTLVYVIAMLVSLEKKKHQPGSRVFVDTDGNGKIDTVYVDTTGDGKADTPTRYREDQ